jgi:hypothetical protein
MLAKLVNDSSTPARNRVGDMKQCPEWGMKSGSAEKNECRLWVQKEDDRWNARQRARRADSRHSSYEWNPGARR